MIIGFNEIRDQLEAIEKRYTSSSLVIYMPLQEHKKFFNDLCQIYLDATDRERWLIRDAVADKKGVLNCLLGHVYESAKQVLATRNKHWLQIGLAAASIQKGGYDYRDFLLALTELYVTAKEVGIDPKPEFKAIGSGIPADFHKYAVVRARLKRLG